MTAALTFEPFPSLGTNSKSNGDSNSNFGSGFGSTAFKFERTDVQLHQQDQIYLLGSLSCSSSDSDAAPNHGPHNNNYSDLEYVFDSDSGSGSEYTRDGQKNRSRTRAVNAVEDVEDEEKVAPVKIVGKKLAIVPAKSRPREMKDVYAAIWLAPGYKVILLPARRHRVFYQRAVPGNRKWKEVDEGHSVDLADPLMTVLDNAIHIKIDVRPEKDKSSSSSSGKDLPSRISKLINRVQQLQKYRSINSSSSTSSREQCKPYLPDVGVRVHTEIEGTEEMHSSRGHTSYYQIAARVSVVWQHDEALEDRLRISPEKGSLYDLRAQREKVWKEMEKDLEGLDRTGRRSRLDHFVANTTSASAEKGGSGGSQSAARVEKQQRSKQRSRSPSPSSSNRHDDSERQFYSGQEDSYLPPPPLSPGVAPAPQESEYTSADEIGVAISTPTATSAPAPPSTSTSSYRPKTERTPSNIAKSLPQSRESSRASRENQSQSQEAKSTHGRSRSRSPGPTASPKLEI